MWWKIAKLAGLFFLGFGAAQDINYQKISTEYLLAGSCAAILYRALFGRMHWSVWVAGLGCGIVFLMISKWSQEGIGYGDSWMILNMGIFVGIWNLLGMLMLAFLVAAMAAGAGLWSGKWKRTTRMSFYRNHHGSHYKSVNNLFSFKLKFCKCITCCREEEQGKHCINN